MCGRFALGDVEGIGARFGIDDFHELRIKPRFNIAPSDLVPVVVPEPEGRRLTLMRWGFQPTWMRQPRRAPPINARAESLLEGRLFRSALGHGRCLIPADGFYEWVAVPGSGPKQPMHVRLRGAPLFGFAGLWTAGPDGQPTCVIITTAANEAIAPIHARMPVVLDPAAEAAWLDPDLTDPAAAVATLTTVPPESLESFPVGPLVSSVREDGPELLDPVEPVI